MPGHPQSLKFIKKFCQLFLEGGVSILGGCAGGITESLGTWTSSAFATMEKERKGTSTSGDEMFWFCGFRNLAKFVWILT